MKSQIVIKEGWKILQVYEFVIPLNKGDYVEFNGIEYEVDCKLFDMNSNMVSILLTE